MSEQRTKGRFSPEQIITFLRRIDAGREASIAEACANFGISRTAYYYWRAKYGPQVDQEQRIARLEAELRALRAELRSARPAFVHEDSAPHDRPAAVL